ncbi:PQQ-binding-like beta-propeller repeat protein [Yinghuangia seranimata]|uniref:outer membrane protein assembly factor BamB family protein n=1 Tax=Yinghuangia seranimata TaxID=408067 RepID=UPI00248BCD5B|nr:PQQ-binding-like beta-propeller repeat protein [Yinghuangia seranimata]MDI2132254.1 PQQ-binding-like beta-propeller repeat protein [Yinghuangia seranimata]
MGTPRRWRGRRLPVGKLVAGGGAVAMLAALGVVAVQAHEVAPCWRDFDKLTDNAVFPDAFPVTTLATFDDPALRAARRDPGFQAAAAFEGDGALGVPVWTIAAQDGNPALTDELGLLAARADGDPDKIAMYEGRNGKRHWMREATRPTAYFMKNLRALTIVPGPDGTTRVTGADARSGYLQWCRSVDVVPSADAAAAPGSGGGTDVGWATGLTGRPGTVLFVGRSGRSGRPQAVEEDTVSGRVTRRWPVDGDWTDIASDGRLVYLAAPGRLAAFRPGESVPVWRAALPEPAGPTAFRAVEDGRVLVASGSGADTVLAAYDSTGRQAWSRAAGGPVLTAGPRVLVAETRDGVRGVAAYRVVDGTPAWFAPAPELSSLADAGADATRLYLPGSSGPHVVNLATGAPVPTTLRTPVDRVVVSGQRVVVQHTAAPGLAWTIAYAPPKSPAEQGTSGDAQR